MKPDAPVPDPNYPRWMYHRSLDPVMIRSEEEETALGAEWSRTVFTPSERPAETEPAPPARPKRGRPRRLDLSGNLGISHVKR